MPRSLLQTIVLLVGLACGLVTSACATVYQDFAFYDESELPGRPFPGYVQHDVYGVYFYPTLPVSPIFTIERIRFWHHEDNDVPDPFSVFIVVRNTSAQHIYALDILEGFTTTCTDCWEEVEIEESYWDTSTPGWSYGVMIQPLGGGFTTAEPRIYMDDAVSAGGINMVASYNDYYGFYNISYLEELFGGGDFFMEIIVRYDETVATAKSSLSTIKALY